MFDLAFIVQVVGYTIDGLGILIIIGGSALSTTRFLTMWRRAGGAVQKPYEAYRQNMSRTILLALEFLIAGDIIRSITVRPTLESVGVLGLIVLIRTFLSMELEAKIGGGAHWFGFGKKK